MAKMFVGDAYEALDKERIALRVKVAILKERWGSQSEYEHSCRRLSELDLQLRAIVAERLCKVGQRVSRRRTTQKPAD